MKTFAYRALTSSGELVSDRLDAQSRQAALMTLTGRGWTPVQLEDASEPGQNTDAIPGNRYRIPPRVVEIFTRQLAALLRAGVPLASALNQLRQETTHKGAAVVWEQLHDMVSDGAALTDAMAQFPKVFSRVYTAMVRAGETGGFLDLVLDQIAEFQTRDRDLKAKVASALIYPCVLAVLAIAVVVFLMVFFIPRFQAMFDDFGAALPALTQGIIGLSEIIKQWGLPIVAAGVVVGVVLRQHLDTEAGARRAQTFILRIPILGYLTARLAMTRFCRMLGTLISAGVPLITGLRVARESVGNQILVDAVDEALRRVQQGNRLADSLRICGQLFPGSVLEMISVSEQAGCLDQELVRIAEMTEKDLDRDLQRAVALAEPGMLFIMAGVVGTIVIGMVLPIFSLQDYIR